MKKSQENPFKKSKNLVFAFTGGGTAGHVYPGISVALALKKIYPFAQFFWIGSKTGKEQNWLLPYPFITYYSISTGKFRRVHSFGDLRFMLQNFLDIFHILWGIFESKTLIKKLRPTIIFSKGGYVSVPVMKGAQAYGVPFFTHESDKTPGLATRLNAAYSQKIFVSYKETKIPKYQHKTLYTGFLLRPELTKQTQGANLNSLLEAKESEHKPQVQALWRRLHTNTTPLPILLVLGGSSGALQINQLIDPLLESLTKKCIVVHQRGPNPIKIEPQSDSNNYFPLPFLDPQLMLYLLQRASLTISRAGANSLGELAYFKQASILIPLQAGSRGDQIDNVHQLKNTQEPSALILEHEVTSTQLSKVIERLLNNALERHHMGERFFQQFDYNGMLAVVEELKKFLPLPHTLNVNSMLKFPKEQDDGSPREG